MALSGPVRLRETRSGVDAESQYFSRFKVFLAELRRLLLFGPALQRHARVVLAPDGCNGIVLVKHTFIRKVRRAGGRRRSSGLTHAEDAPAREAPHAQAHGSAALVKLGQPK